jgi:transposase-like protein
MVVPNMDLSEEADPDLLRAVVQLMAETLMSADADATCNAATASAAN